MYFIFCTIALIDTLLFTLSSVNKTYLCHTECLLFTEHHGPIICYNRQYSCRNGVTLNTTKVVNVVYRDSLKRSHHIVMSIEVCILSSASQFRTIYLSITIAFVNESTIRRVIDRYYPSFSMFKIDHQID